MSKKLWGNAQPQECDRRTRNDIGVNLKRLQAGFNGVFGESGGVEPQLLLEPEERLVAVLLRLAQHVRQEVAGRQRTACTPENTVRALASCEAHPQRHSTEVEVRINLENGEFHGVDEL